MVLGRPEGPFRKFAVSPSDFARKVDVRRVEQLFCKVSRLTARPLFAYETKSARLRRDPIKGEGQEGRERQWDSPVAQGAFKRAPLRHFHPPLGSEIAVDEHKAARGRIRGVCEICVNSACESIKAPALSAKRP